MWRFLRNPRNPANGRGRMRGRRAAAKRRPIGEDVPGVVYLARAERVPWRFAADRVAMTRRVDRMKAKTSEHLTRR